MENLESNFDFESIAKYILSKVLISEIEKVCLVPILIEYMEENKYHYREGLSPEKGEAGKLAYFIAIGKKMLELYFKERKEGLIGPLTNRYNQELREYHLKNLLGE